MIDFLISFDFYRSVVLETYKERPSSIIQDMKDYLAEHHRNIKVQSIGTKTSNSFGNVFKIKVSQDTPELTLFKLKYSEYIQ